MWHFIDVYLVIFSVVLLDVSCNSVIIINLWWRLCFRDTSKNSRFNAFFCQNFLGIYFFICSVCVEAYSHRATLDSYNHFLRVLFHLQLQGSAAFVTEVGRAGLWTWPQATFHSFRHRISSEGPDTSKEIDLRCSGP